MKRNNVVLINSFYGRVIKRLPNNRWLALTCGLHFYSIPEDYPVSDYKGYSRGWDEKGRFVPMTSIRKLKKRAMQFHYQYAHNTPSDYEYIQVVEE
jgi:hypothetical protein